MIFRTSFRYDNEDWNSIWGQVFFDKEGNKYFRAGHMSQMCSEASMMKSMDKCAEWRIELFLDQPEFNKLLNKLAPVSIGPFISP